MLVSFIDVGRDKKNWDAEMESLSDRALKQEIRDHRALLSSGVDFIWDDEGTSARIHVGIFRHVGDIRVNGGMKA